MKVHSRNLQDSSLIDIIVVIDENFYDDDMINNQVAASSDISRFKLPEGPVISSDRKKITQQMISDYESFIDDIEILCEETYGLVITYQNESNDLSHYYSFLVKDSKGNIVTKIRLRLRISNHDAKRTKRSQHNKKLETQTEELQKYLTEKQIVNLATRSVQVVVNDENFDNYIQAFERVDALIERSIEVMNR